MVLCVNLIYVDIPSFHSPHQLIIFMNFN
uniref:Uncharacterized protein n=1 Tax=Anguilla anguilla TaxID=7936 RepID=A0A0E9QFK0_ANGAN